MRTIRYFVDKKAREHPEKTYLIAPEPGFSLSYLQLKEDSIRLGKHLLKLGLKKGAQDLLYDGKRIPDHQDLSGNHVCRVCDCPAQPDVSAFPA